MSIRYIVTRDPASFKYDLIKLLDEKGFKVRREIAVKGRSGHFHVVNIAASRGRDRIFIVNPRATASSLLRTLVIAADLNGATVIISGSIPPGLPIRLAGRMEPLKVDRRASLFVLNN